MRRKIAVITGTRADYGLLRGIITRIHHDQSLRLQLIVCGSHVASAFGLTIREIEADGLPIADRIDMLLASNSAESIAVSTGLGTTLFAHAYNRLRPDVVVVLGDRFEILAAATAACLMKIPVAHIHGGEVTEGAVDEQIRHAVTKLSHLHFVATERYAARLRQMGEEPWRVIVAGAPGVEALKRAQLLDRTQLEHELGHLLHPPVVLATLHPATLDRMPPLEQHRVFVAGLAAFRGTVVFTAPNADEGGAAMRVARAAPIPQPDESVRPHGRQHLQRHHRGALARHPGRERR
jgi:UDP-hydrolysing UDP-N-acetyl-D-glucosamine 2-epimerase